MLRPPYVWHRYFTTYTGHFDERYFPENLYALLELYMNPSEYVKAFSDKNITPMIASAAGISSPKVVVSRVNGIYRDSNMNKISFKNACDLIIRNKIVFY